jgi:hypothetical protein
MPFRFMQHAEMRAMTIEAALAQRCHPVKTMPVGRTAQALAQ